MKIITHRTPDHNSHIDHGLSPAVVDFIMTRLGNRDAFFIETLELPSELGLVSCNLHGPEVGEPEVGEDEVQYVVRGERTWKSRICARPPALSNKVTVIAGPDEGEPCVLYTAYGGPLAPREPGDPDLKDDDEREKAILFWRLHALGREV